MLRPTNKNKKYALRKIGKYFGPCVIGTMIAIGVAAIPSNEVHATRSEYVPYKVYDVTITPDQPETVYKADDSKDVGYRDEKKGTPGKQEIWSKYEKRYYFTNKYPERNEATMLWDLYIGNKNKTLDEDGTIPAHPDWAEEYPDNNGEEFPKRIDENKDGTFSDKDIYDEELHKITEYAERKVESNKKFEALPDTVKPENSDESSVLTDNDDNEVVADYDSDNKVVRLNPHYYEIRDTPKVDTVIILGTKPTVVTEEIPYTTRYVRDDTRGRDYREVTTPGKNGKRITTTTYTLNTTNGDVTANEPTVAVTDAIEEVITLGTQPKVVEEPIPSPKRYEKDGTKEKGQPNEEIPGNPGTRTTTTTYEVDSKTGNVTEHVGDPIEVVAPTETVVKVPAKDKVVTEEIPVTTTYVEDPEKEVGTPEVVENLGKAGKIITTTPYTVKPDGSVTEGDPVVTREEMTPKVVRVGTKPKGTTPEGAGTDSNLKVAQPTIAIVEEPDNKASIQVKAPEKDADTVEITYPKSDGSGNEVLTLTKQSSGEWTLDKQPEKVTLDKKMGTVTIPREAIVNKQKVQARSKNGNSGFSLPVYEVLSIEEANPVGLVTRWVAQIDNITLKTLRDEVSGKEPAGEFEGYKWLSSRLENGILTHTFEINSGNLPPVNLIPEKPSSKTENPVIRTVWRDENGKDLKTPSVEKQEAGEVEGYEFVESHREGDNLTVHVFRTRKSQTPSPAPSKVSEQKGETVATTTSEKTVENGTSTNESDKAELPNTGTETNASLANAGIMTLLAGLGLGFFKKKEDEN